MNTTSNIRDEIDSRIAEEELPVSGALKVIRRNDPNYGMSEDEIQDRNEFIRWYMLQELNFLTMIPEQEPEDDFFLIDYTVDDKEYSALNSMDFQRTLRPFNKYAYAMKKIMERVQDLAILHSVVSSHHRRKDIHQRYEALVEYEFRNRLMALYKRYQNTKNDIIKLSIKQKMGEINRRILDCKKIWEQYAPWDT